MKACGGKFNGVLRGLACAFFALCCVAVLFLIQAYSISRGGSASRAAKIYSLPAPEPRPPKKFSLNASDMPRELSAAAQSVLPVEIPRVSASSFAIPAGASLSAAPAAGDFSIALFSPDARPDISSDIFSVDMLDKIPRRLDSLRPAYPRQMLRRGIEGEVSLEVVIDQSGSLTIERVVSATNNFFRDSAVQTARGFVYEPPTRGGKPVRARFVLPIPFRISR